MGNCLRHAQMPTSSPEDSDPLTSVEQSELQVTASTSSKPVAAAVFVPQSDSVYYVLRKTQDVSCDYDIQEELGKGQFGVVSVATERSTGQRYAIKTINKRRAETRENQGKDIRTEVEILYHLAGHPNIVKLHDVYEDEDSIHLILELCEGGNWFERLLTRGTYSERNAAMAAHTLLEALAFCHGLGVVHRDIKPENILFTDRSESSPMKFADFGLSALMAEAASIHHSGGPWLYDPVGSTYYVAPEVLKERGYGKECDVWSLGIMLFVTLGGYPPFEGPSEQKVFTSIMYKPLRFNDPTWNSISLKAKDFIGRMLCKDPRRRATVSELLGHPWLESFNSGTRKESDLPVPDAVVSRLQRFSAMNEFKKEARKVLASILPEEEVIGMLNIFREMDSDKDGCLTLDELHAAIAKKGIHLRLDQAQELLHCADMNNDGVIDYKEFLAATVHQQRLDKDELRFQAFQHFDRNRSGFISKEELRQALSKEGEKLDLDGILEAVDSDHDGRIDYQEFCNFMQARESDSGLGPSISLHASPSRVLNVPGWLSGKHNSKTNREDRESELSRSKHQTTAGEDLLQVQGLVARPLSKAELGCHVRFNENNQVASINEIDRKRAQNGNGSLAAAPSRGRKCSDRNSSERDQRLAELSASSSRLISGTEALGIIGRGCKSKGVMGRSPSVVSKENGDRPQLQQRQQQQAESRGRSRALLEPIPYDILIRDASLCGYPKSPPDCKHQQELTVSRSIFPPIRLPNSTQSRPSSCASSVKNLGQEHEKGSSAQLDSAASSFTSKGCLGSRSGSRQSSRSRSRPRSSSRCSSRGVSPRCRPGSHSMARPTGMDGSRPSSRDASCHHLLVSEACHRALETMSQYRDTRSEESEGRLVTLLNKRLLEIKNEEG